MTPDRWIVTSRASRSSASSSGSSGSSARPASRAETSGGYQEAMILVKGGYTPDTIIVRAAGRSG